MNVHTRIRKALEHEEPDRVPTLAQYFEPVFRKKIRKNFNMIERLKYIFEKHWQVRTAKLMGFDSVWYHYGRHNIPSRDRPELPEEIKKKYKIKKVNNWGHYSEYDLKSKMSWYVDGALKTPEFLREWISWLNTWEPADEKHFIRFRKIWDESIRKGVVPIPTGGTVSYGTWSSIGINRFAYMVRKHLNLVKQLAKALGKITMDYQTCMFEHGIDMAFVCDDWAMKDRLIFHPKQWDEIIGPVFKMIADNAHKHDAKFLVHTDGNITDCVPYIVKSGADAIEPLEYESGARLKPLKEEFGDKITLIGNVPATFSLTFGSVEETIKMTKECIDIAAAGGGYILGAGSDILGTCKIENVKAMTETAKNYGRYKKT
ncbi:MAG: hypothetical protein GF364_07900 [Candidatus Lokiarchaeota archaeon]|nr:hypothetical protein [Candidatus Lokiarchaeota archaeon]